MIKLNWILRLKNKATLVALIPTVVAFVYLLIGFFNHTIDTTQEALINAGFMFVDILVILGIVVDPTTHGINDSDRAMDYTEPRKDEIES